MPDATRNKLYLAGITKAWKGSREIKIKNKVIEAALSERWLQDNAIKRKGIAKIAREKYDEKRYKEALDLFESYISTNELPVGDVDSFLIYYRTGICAYHLHEYEKAIGYFKKVHIDKTVYPSVYYDNEFTLGICCSELGRVDESITHYTEALNAPKKDVQYIGSLINLGIMFANKNALVEAINHFKKALSELDIESFEKKDKDKLTAAVHYHFAAALHKTGKPEEARGHYEMAIFPVGRLHSAGCETTALARMCASH